ncbi:hypothetical protein M433DRAFT_156735 [Acidomyces richmondensis BFW]|nr:hypothetical protein M433DRAFT_156735 [Acidomyces richmondensis BFW]
MPSANRSHAPRRCVTRQTMPSSSRSSRPAPRSSGGLFAKSPDAPSARSRPTTHISRQTDRPSNLPTIIPDSDSDNGLYDDGRPTKRRKLSIRHKQTTLDHHFVPATQSEGPTRPPTKLTVERPHGQLVETLNGVRTTLNVDEDDLATGSSATRTPSRLSHTDGKPSTALGQKEDKRTLRSQDEGPRLKSELATYFPNYEDIVFDVRKEPELMTVDMVLYITDDASKQQQQSSTVTSPQKGKSTPIHMRNGSVNPLVSPTSPQTAMSSRFNGCSPINLDTIARNIPDNPEDPLSDEHYLKSHRRAERKEKQLRNIEKERAMHEKVQLERLLDGLQGHDWLKVLGITGITDGESKKYEPQREYFISEVQALVNKFKEWKEQEKKMRLEKEAAAAAREAESDERETEDSVEPPSSELNASASRQLLQETNNAVRSGLKIQLNSHKKKDNKRGLIEQTTSAKTRPVAPPSPEAPITSFYAKKYLRDAAIGKSRHGRNVTAFGHPIPDMEEQEFELPSDYMTEDALRANARERRRKKRASIADANSA